MDYDLNVKPRSTREKDRINVAIRVLELGYSCVAWNVTAFGKISPNSQFKPLSNVDLNAVHLRQLEFRRRVVTSSPAQLRQYSRLTISVEEIAEAQILSSPNDALSRFDIIAACPANSKVLGHLCRQGDIDIISLDFTHRLQFPLNKKMLDAAVARGITFEIQYSPVLSAPASRRQVISTTRVLVQYLKGKGVILTSGAESLSHMRSPTDVMLLGQCLGIPAHQARMTVSENCAMVLKHAAARKLRYNPVEVLSMAEFYQRWPEMQEVLSQSCAMVGQQSSGGKRSRENVEDSESDESAADVDADDCDEEDTFTTGLLGGNGDFIRIPSNDDEPHEGMPNRDSKVARRTGDKEGNKR